MIFVRNTAGIVLVFVICWLISWNRKAIAWKTIGKAFVLEFLIAFLIIRIPVGQSIVSHISESIMAVIDCGNEGLSFVFGDLFDASKMYVFLIQSLGNIIFVSALVSALYYLGVIGFVVKWIGRAVGRLMGTTEVESFVAVANMFLGHTDSPILVANYLKQLTDSEIFLILVSGMGSMSAAILGGYHALGIPMEYLLVAIALVPFGSIMVSKIICPQTERVNPVTDVKMDNRGSHMNIIDAVSEGASTGMHMILSIGASIIGFVGLVAVFDRILGVAGISLSQIFSVVFAPFAYLLGLEGEQLLLEGSLLGNKLILNEFIAFGELADHLGELDNAAARVCAISLSGFANVASMGMCVGSIGVLCPEKRKTIARLVFRSMIAGALVSINSALVVSMITRS